MAQQTEIYFDPADMQTLLSSSPDGILVVCTTAPNPAPSPIPGPVLVAFAVANNSQGGVLSVILGCPTPCKPGGGGINDCKNDSAALLQQLKTLIPNPMEYLSSF
jgi:hypothetical protein